MKCIISNQRHCVEHQQLFTVIIGLLSGYYHLNILNLLTMNEIGHFMSDIDSHLYRYNIMADLNVNQLPRGRYGEISAYHNYRCEFEPRSWRGVLGTTICDKDCQ